MGERRAPPCGATAPSIRAPKASRSTRRLEAARAGPLWPGGSIALDRLAPYFKLQPLLFRSLKLRLLGHECLRSLPESPWIPSIEAGIAESALQVVDIGAEGGDRRGQAPQRALFMVAEPAFCCVGLRDGRRLLFCRSRRRL